MGESGQITQELYEYTSVSVSVSRAQWHRISTASLIAMTHYPYDSITNEAAGGS